MEIRPSGIIQTFAGNYSKEKFNALIGVRETALESLRASLKSRGYSEVLTASLVNIAGSCENPHASFSVNYYGREAHLSQSAQLQLETLVIRLKKGFYTVNNSFREENYADPEKKNRMLSEFTLIEPEKPYLGFSPEDALKLLMDEEEKILTDAISVQLKQRHEEINLLGGDIEYLKIVAKSKFARITYDGALQMLNKHGGNYKFGDDLGIKEERVLLKEFDNIPLFVSHFPAKLKFFNMKRAQDNSRTYSADLLMPKLGETVGGAVREEDGAKIKQYLHGSKFGELLKSRNINPDNVFKNYFDTFSHEPNIMRAGYGIGFERFIAFLIGSTDILETIAYRTLTPAQE